MLNKFIFYLGFPFEMIFVLLSLCIVYPFLFVTYHIWRRRTKRKFRNSSKEYGLVASAIVREQFPNTFKEYADHVFLRGKYFG